MTVSEPRRHSPEELDIIDRRLQEHLRAAFGDVHPDEWGVLFAYALVRAACAVSTSKPMAHALVESLVDIMHEQIERFPLDFHP